MLVVDFRPLLTDWGKCLEVGSTEFFFKCFGFVLKD